MKKCSNNAPDYYLLDFKQNSPVTVLLSPLHTDEPVMNAVAELIKKPAPNFKGYFLHKSLNFNGFVDGDHPKG